jgi:hypothetical protein
MHRGNTVEDESADASEPAGSWRRNKGDDGISHVKKVIQCRVQEHLVLAEA